MVKELSDQFESATRVLDWAPSNLTEEAIERERYNERVSHRVYCSAPRLVSTLARGTSRLGFPVAFIILFEKISWKVDDSRADFWLADQTAFLRGFVVTRANPVPAKYFW